MSYFDPKTSVKIVVTVAVLEVTEMVRAERTWGSELRVFDQHDTGLNDSVMGMLRRAEHSFPAPVEPGPDDE